MKEDSQGRRGPTGAGQHTTKAQLRSGRRRIDQVADLQARPEQPEDILFDLDFEPPEDDPACS